METENKTDLEESEATNMEVSPGKKELNLEDMESVVEVPMEEAAVKSLGAMKKHHRGRHLAAGRHGEPKELT
jgi:hypothetical protein